VRDFDANLNLSGNHINFIVPIYVRAGAIIPTIELEQYVRAQRLTLCVRFSSGGESAVVGDNLIS
jgi:hypothetical protein